MAPDLAGRLRAGRRGPLFDVGALPRLVLDRAGVEGLLPHRGSMLLVDELLGADPAAGLVVGRRTVCRDDPVLAGHFPGDPVYPGALQVEAVGQCGLCLVGLGRPAAAAPPAVRLVRILGAEFVAPVRPGDECTLLAERLDDGLTWVVLGQMLVDGRPTCVCAFEAMILDDEEATGV